jgi:hypothetical protein
MKEPERMKNQTDRLYNELGKLEKKRSEKGLSNKEDNIFYKLTVIRNKFRGLFSKTEKDIDNIFKINT